MSNAATARRRNAVRPPEAILALNTLEELATLAEFKAQELLGVSYHQALKRLDRGDLRNTINEVEIVMLRILLDSAQSR